MVPSEFGVVDGVELGGVELEDGALAGAVLAWSGLAGAPLGLASGGGSGTDPAGACASGAVWGVFDWAKLEAGASARAAPSASVAGKRGTKLWIRIGTSPENRADLCFVRR